MSDALQLGDSLALPLDMAAETFAILAKKGAGKSNAAVVMGIGTRINKLAPSRWKMRCGAIARKI